MLGFKRRVLAGAVSLLAAGSVSAAALKLDVMINGQPVESANVFLNGRLVGDQIPSSGLWLDDIGGGEHQLELEVGGRRIPIEFSLTESQAAFIAVVSEGAQRRPFTSVQHVPLGNVQVSRSAEGVQNTTVDNGVTGGLVPGVIDGTLTTAERNSPVRNAVVTVLGEDVSTTSDRYGQFSLELPQGEYRLRVEHPGHQNKVLSGVRVLPDLSLELSVELQPQSFDNDTAVVAPPVMEEVLVMGAYQPNNSIDVERSSASVVDSLNFEEMDRFDDSMLSGAIKRVVGVSLEDDRYAIVRGMKSRYQSTYFDGVILPSTDPGRRDLPLDIFPSTIMQALSLQKSATADVPGNATAGHIDMRTKDVPDEPFLNMSISYGYGDAQDDEAFMVNGGGRDEWGMDDGFRDMPEEAAAVSDFYFDASSGQEYLPPEEVEAVGESFNHYGAHWGDPRGDVSASLGGGRSWYLGGQRLGLIGAVRYSSKWSNNEKTQYVFGRASSRIYHEDGTFERDPDNLILALRDGIQTRDTDNIVDISAMLNLAWELNDDHQLGLNNILLRHTTNSVEQATNYRILPEYDRETGGYVVPEGAPPDWSWNERTSVQSIDWIEEELVSHLLKGEHRFSMPGDFLGDLQADWWAMMATSDYDRPDAKRYTWTGLATAQDASPEIRTGPSNNYMLWENMGEDTTGYRLDLSLPLAEGQSVNSLLKVGGYLLDRERTGHRYTWYYGSRGSLQLPQRVQESPDPAEIFVPEYIVGSTAEEGLVLAAGGVTPENDVGLENGNHYMVEQKGDSWYLLADTDFWGRLRANIGVRQETFEILADQFSYTPEPLFSLLDDDRILPSAGLTYHFNDAWQLRAAYSETVSWPEVFEVLPRTFRNIETLTTYVGNPDLEPADIKNYDLRLEWYPSDTESVTLALFHKDITNGIEDTFDRSGDDYSYYTFQNVESATVDGWEIDLRQEFSFGADFGHGLFVQANYIDITSEVDLPPGTREYDPGRPFQGQPDYIVNLMMGYDHLNTGQELSLVFNRKGKELAVVTPAVGNSVSNVYTEPYDDLKLVYRKNFLNGLALSVAGENLLDSESSQVYEREGAPYLRYKSGRRYKVTVDYEF